MKTIIVTEKSFVSQIYSEAISRISNEIFALSDSGNYESEKFTITHVMGACFNERNIIYGSEEMDSEQMKRILKERGITIAVTIDFDSPKTSYIKGENFFSIQNNEGVPFVVLTSQKNLNNVGRLISNTGKGVVINACDASEEGDLLFDYVLRVNSLKNDSLRLLAYTNETTELDNKWRQLLEKI